MPWLVGMLVSGFSGILSWFALHLSKRIALIAALTAFFIAGWVALQVAAYAAFSGLTFAASPWMAKVLSAIATLLPSNFGACVTAIVAFAITRFVWDKQREWAKMISYVT